MIHWGQTRIYEDPAKQRKWDRIVIRRFLRSRLGVKWRDRDLPDMPHWPTYNCRCVLHRTQTLAQPARTNA